MSRRWVLVLMLSLAACSPANHDTGSDALSSESLLPPQERVQAIVANHCVSCHTGVAATGGINYMDQLDQVIAHGLVVPGNPGASSFYVEAAEGRMPVSYRLSASDLTAIEEWILGLGATAPPPAGPVGTFADVAVILNARCVTCHGAATQIPLVTYDDVLKTLTPGNAKASLIYDAVFSQRMPQAGGPLSEAEIQTIKTWIDAGAAM